MTLSWFSIVRLGLIQMALGAIVVLTTSTLNRLMIVELALPAVLPGLLVALHYGIQITRPNWGFLSDAGGNRTKWIILGMIALALGALMAAFGVIVLEAKFLLGMMISVIAYALIGLGVGASGTSLLALLATYTVPSRRAAAATITWLMMIAGIAITAGVVGAVLDPYSPERLLRIVAVVTAGAVLITILAIWRIEVGLPKNKVAAETKVPFLEGLKEVWAETPARNFTIFVFLSMTAYFMQELILEPFAGLVFEFTPGQSTSLSGAQNGGVFVGMLSVGILATGLRFGALRSWVIFGCLSSAVALVIIANLAALDLGHLLIPATVFLGFSNGVFAVAAIGSMMAQAGEGRERREGTRMGLWGAAQAIAAGFGGLLGAALVDVMRGITGNTALSFGAVFTFEAIIFLAAAIMAYRTLRVRSPQTLNMKLVAGE